MFPSESYCQVRKSGEEVVAGLGEIALEWQWVRLLVRRVGFIL